MAVHSKQKNTEANYNLLLSAFAADKTLSISDIQSLLGCNRQSAYNYIKRLKENGCQLQQKTIHNKSYYMLDSSSSEDRELAAYSPLTANIVRKYHIVQSLRQNPAAKKELWETMQETMDIGRTAFFKLVDELIAEGEIQYQNKKYSPAGKNIPFVLDISDLDTLITMQNELSNIAPGHPYYTQLHTVCQKIDQLLGNVDSDDPFYRNYIIYGRKYTNTIHISNQLKKLDKHDYKNKILKIQYTPYGSPQISLLFAVGIIVYCLEKDTLYLLGLNQDNQLAEVYSPFTIIDMNTIDDITDTDLEICKYIWDETQNANIPVSDLFQEISETMLSISIEPAQKVEVVFDRSENIEQELAHFQSQRKHSAVHKTEDTILYTDEIRGITDFTSYLRQYADQIKSLEPEALKDWIVFSTERSLARYLQIDADTV